MGFLPKLQTRIKRFLIFNDILSYHLRYFKKKLKLKINQPNFSFILKIKRLFANLTFHLILLNYKLFQNNLPSIYNNKIRIFLCDALLKKNLKKYILPMCLFGI